MKTRKILCLLLAVLLFTVLSVPAFAETTAPKVIDEAGLLSESERSALEKRAEALVRTYSMDVVILTNNSLDGKTSEAFADDYFDYNGYGIGANYSGILLLVSMSERDWAISTCGDAIYAVTDYGNQLLQDAILSDLSAGNYYDAFDGYLSELEYLFERYSEGSPVDVAHGSAQRGRLTIGKVLLCIGIAAAISGIATFVMVKGMNTATRNNQAGAYLKKDSFHLTTSRDIFLYSTTTKTCRQKNSGSSGGGGSSTHHSSSGSSHGGSHGKF